MADLSQFRPGNIISDAKFFDNTTMNVQQIDAFLQSKVSVCRSSYACLKSYSQHTPNKAADAYCNGYTAGLSEYASTIIYKVAQSCGINPQVLITMLEKEQSLVTSAFPSIGRFNAAMGQGCPDTAGCDPAYAGFFHQVYGAARQMKIYAEGRWFTYYAPGKTWNILYHPTASRGCGSSPVYIENTATAALYYYTPYQPNRAALNAGYGEGDYCSSYGNRNFYQLFTDWFGSTQVAAIRLIKASDADAIYLVADKKRFHITNATDLAAYMAAIGWYQTVSPTAVAAIPNAGVATRFIRDGRDGGMYLIEPDGSKHHFATADHVTRFGFDMAAYTSLPAALVDAFRSGAAVGAYFKAENDDRYFRWENATKRHVVNQQAWSRLPAADRAYVATLPASSANAIPVGLPILPAGMTVREHGSSDVFIAGTGAEIVHIPTWGVARDAGIADSGTIPSGTLAKNTRIAGSLTAFVSCGSAKYVVDGGGLTRVQTVASGVRITSLPDSLCASIPKTGRTLGDAVLAKTPGADPVYLIQGNQLRHIRSQQRLLEANGNRALYFLSWTADTRSGFEVGAPLLADGSFVTLGTDETFYVEGGLLRHVQSTTTLIRLAAPRWPSVEALPATFGASYQRGAPIP